MVTISLCMIVKNEEKVLERCLNSAKNIADEIIIVDTGSKDKTKDIAHKYTDKVYDFKWIDDFSAARNYSFSKATKDYILWLDADDVILEKDNKNFIKLKENLNLDYDMIFMKYNSGFDENGNVTFSYFRERLLKRTSNPIWQSPIHEVIAPKGKLLYCDICITHKKEKEEYSTRNLEIFENMIKKGILLDPRQPYYYSRELMYNHKYLKAIDNFNTFLKMKGAWLENIISACLDLYTCYLALNIDEMAIYSLFRSFLYDSPRAEICTTIGIYFMNKQNYKTAIYWFKAATTITPDFESGAFIMTDLYDFIPYLNLCVCYDKLGDKKMAKKKVQIYFRGYIILEIIFLKNFKKICQKIMQIF